MRGCKTLNRRSGRTGASHLGSNSSLRPGGDTLHVNLVFFRLRQLLVSRLYAFLLMVVSLIYIASPITIPMPGFGGFAMKLSIAIEITTDLNPSVGPRRAPVIDAIALPDVAQELECPYRAGFLTQLAAAYLGARQTSGNHQLLTQQALKNYRRALVRDQPRPAFSRSI